MTRGARRAVLVVVIGVLAAGCGSSSTSDDSATEPTMTKSPTASSSSTDGAAPTADAMADLASRLDVAADSIEVVGEEAVSWSDGSLGCAKPGKMYTQAIVEGWRVTLRADGTDYEYHSAGTGTPAWCRKPTQ